MTYPKEPSIDSSSASNRPGGDTRKSTLDDETSETELLVDEEWEKVGSTVEEIRRELSHQTRFRLLLREGKRINGMQKHC